ncbi:hypothetical protein M3Y99_01852200 [Aphelenchoides fujianensis]|nr:hypothetical protein M3Y99_01852200 [Aphelenchoides fujianensis]
MGGNEKPIVALSVNLDEIMLEAVGLLRSARYRVETVTSAINERMNVSMDSTMDDVVSIGHTTCGRSPTTSPKPRAPSTNRSSSSS